MMMLALWLLGALAVSAQTPPPTPSPAWETVFEEGLALVGDEVTPTAELKLLREQLLRLRGEALEVEAAAAPRVADVSARLEALGPAPAEGATEDPALAERRARIEAELSAAQAPVLEAQDYQRRSDALIRDIDRIVRARFAAELTSLGPSPLLPGNLVETVEAAVSNDSRIRGRLAEALSDPVVRADLMRRIPAEFLMALIGITIVFVVRRRLTAWVEHKLERATEPRAIALLVTVRNLGRLIVPTVGVGLLFATLDPEQLLNPTPDRPHFVVPNFALAIIGAAWLASSLYAPKLPRFRLVPLGDAAALRSARVTIGLGLVIAVKLLLTRYVTDWEMTPAAAATLEFPLFVVGGALLWGASRILRSVRRALLQPEPAGPDRTGTITLTLIGFAERGTWLLAFAAPALAAVGFYAMADFVLYGAILTLGLVGACVVVYDLILTTAGAVLRTPDPDRSGTLALSDGLAPIVLGTVVTLAALPLLALIWGARYADIADVWFMLRDGVTLGGMRISLGMVVGFAIVFAILFGLTRILQSLLRGTVLPRTKLDAGGRNAVLAGVGYTGFFIAATAAVSSTGVDLTSLAVVAGALSVGIGFGLQNIVSNFVSGIILLVERPIKEGDWIEVGGHAGYVRGISVRSTEIETFERASVILPNSDLVAGTVLNRTHTGMSGRIAVPVGVSYSSDPRQVERILIAIAEDHPMVLPEPNPRVLFTGFGDNSLNFEIRCWLRDVNFSLSARSDLNFEIFARFEKEGISIPFPHRELRFREGDLRGAVEAALGAVEAPEKS